MHMSIFKLKYDWAYSMPHNTSFIHSFNSLFDSILCHATKTLAGPFKTHFRRAVW